MMVSFLGSIFMICIALNVVNVSSALTDAEKSDVLDWHNTIRSETATGQSTACSGGNCPSASNMVKMNWVWS